MLWIRELVWRVLVWEFRNWRDWGEAKTNVSTVRKMKCRNVCVFCLLVLFVCDLERQTPPIFESNMFDQSFQISAVFQSRTFDLFCLSCNKGIICMCSLLKSLIRHQFQNILTVVAWSVSTPYERTNTRTQWQKIDVQLTLPNSV
jgi:hypothetical protein